MVVGTPLGNLEDLSPRAAAALREATLIACEDTRRSGVLAHHVGATGRLISLHAHNEQARLATVCNAVRDGERVALVSDAGMPAVSDPGARVVQAVREAGGAVWVVPGPSAVTTALVASGAPADRFVFAGFVPRKDGDRLRWQQRHDACAATVVAFDSPQRVGDTLTWLAREDPARRVAVCRELTKLYEQVECGSADAMADAFRDGARGEITLVLWPAAPVDDHAPLMQAVEVLRAAGLGPRAVADAVAALGLGSRNAAYAAASQPPAAHPDTTPD